MPNEIDSETLERARKGVRPDAIGWKAIGDALGVNEKTARSWERAGLPVTNWGPRLVAAYSDRLRAWAATPRRRPAAA